MMLQYLVLVGFVLAMGGTISYLRDTLLGRIKPNKVSWLMWSVAPFIATVAALSKGVTWAVLPVFLSGFGSFCVFIASFFNKNAYWKLTIFDYVCGACSVLALVLWSITKEANVAIIFAISGDFSASIPTLKKAWTNPETESVLPYIGDLMVALTAFAAIRYWIFSAYAYAAYLVLCDTALIFSVSGRKILKKVFLLAEENKV